MNKKNRENKIIVTSIIGIIVNLVIAIIKITIGLIVNSIAFISEGINNGTDCLSSIITVIGANISKKKPDEKHPFGYGRIEYLSSLSIGILIIIAGFNILKDSFFSILKNELPNLTIISIIIIFITAIIKLILGIYTISIGKKTNSDSLVAIGIEGRNDCLLSFFTIISGVIFFIFNISIDGYVGIILSLVVLKNGIECIKNSTSKIIGEKGKEELANKLYKEIRSEKDIIYVADMILHNYGPNRYSGSVNIEIDHKAVLGDIYEKIHGLQLRIMEEYNTVMVFGLYAVDREGEDYKHLRKVIGDFVREDKRIKNMHALYLSKKTNSIYCDFILDYGKYNWEEIRLNFLKYMDDKYKGYKVNLVLETEFI